MCFGRLFHVIWNAVPVELEHCSNLSGTAFHLSCNNAGCQNAHCKNLSGEPWEMAFGGWKGELLVVIGCGTSRLDYAKLVSNVTWIQDKTQCFREQDLKKYDWLPHQLAPFDTRHNDCILSRTPVGLHAIPSWWQRSVIYIESFKAVLLKFPLWYS